LLGTNDVLNLIAGNWLVFAHANPGLECVSLATLSKFIGQTLQTPALREETADNSYQRIRLTRCTAFSASCAKYRIE
jgi:hypothetical protein